MHLTIQKKYIKNYDILIKISPNKLHIFDDVNNKFISYPNVLDDKNNENEKKNI